MKKDKKILLIIMIVVITGIINLFADTFTENFDNANYKDTTQTTTNWPAVVDLKNVTVLERENKFAETTGVINWGGGITAIDCNATQGRWLIGGEGGKINEYDGNNFINHSNDLGFGTSDVGVIRFNGSYWLIGSGTATKLKKWDGSVWTDLSSNLIGFSGGIFGIDYDSGNGYWLIGGVGGAINKYDGVTWSDKKLDAGFGTTDIRAIRYNGSYWIVAGLAGKIKRYNGSVWTDLTANLEAVWDPGAGNVYYDIYAVDWDSVNNVWVIGGGSGKLATYNGTSFTDKSSSVTISTIWSIHYNGNYTLIGGVYGSQTRLYTTSDNSTYYLQSNPGYFNIDPIWAIRSNGGGASGINLICGRNGRIMKRTGGVNTPTNTDLSGSIRDFGKLNINAAGWNGSYWLIGGENGSINKYDGEVFVDLKSGLTTAGWVVSDSILSIGWNGSYWFIGGANGSLYAYDGVSFTSKTSALGFGSDSVYVIKWGGTSGNEQWVIGGGSRKLKRSSDGNTFTTVDISSYFGVTDAVRAADFAGTLYNVWFIGGDSGCIIKYDGGSTINDLKTDLYSTLGGYYQVNTIKWDEGVNNIIRVGCNSAKLADYNIFNFTDMSGNLIGFGTDNVKSINYSAGSGKWFIGGSGGKINSDTSGIFVNESGNLINFGNMTINSVVYNGNYWIIGGDYAKLNRYGMAYNQSGWAVSTVIDHYGYKYECATLTAVDKLNDQGIDYYISSNNGVTWIQVTPGVGVCFSGGDAGEDLRWKAYLYTYDLFKSAYIDSITIEYSRNPAPTYTITPTHTDSPTETITETITETWTYSPTMTITDTITETATETVTETITETVTETVTKTISATITETVTPTATGTITQTITGTVTPTITATITETVTETVTETITQTITGTTTSTITATITETVTETITPTITFTITLTVTPTITWTITPTVTRTSTQTVTQTITHTITRTFTQTITRTITHTVTTTNTPTITQTVTPTITGTNTQTVTSTITKTITQTNTQTVTSTITQTLTPTITPTFTPTKAVDHFDIEAPASVEAGQIFYITVTAKTSDNLVVENYYGTVHFTTNASLYQLPEDYTYTVSDAGSHIFQVTLMTAGLITINVNDTINVSITGHKDIIVNPANAVSFTILAPSTVNAGDTFYITVTAKDQYNNVVTDYTGTVRFTSSDPQAQLPPDTQFNLSDAGVKILSAILKTKGIQTISATDILNSSITGTSNGINVQAGSVVTFLVVAPSIANSNVSFNFYVTAKDAFNNTIDNYTGTVTFSSTDSLAELPANYTFLTSDMGSRIFEATLKTAGIQTITVSQVGSPSINGTSNNINVVVPVTSYNRPILLTSYLTQQNHYEYCYIKIDDRNFTFNSNYYLEYDVYIPEISSNFYCSTEFQGGSYPGGYSNMRDFGQTTQNYIRDQNAIRIHPSMDISTYAKGNWYHRKFDVSMLATTGYYNYGLLSQDTGNIGYNGAPSNNPGTFNAFFDNVVYTNASGTIVWDVFSNTYTMKVGASPYVVMNNIPNGSASSNDSWKSTTTYPIDNYVWVIDGWKAWANPSSGIVADGIQSATITAYVWTPPIGSNTNVAYALIDFESDRSEDIIDPITVSLNSYAITDFNGNAYARIRSTKAGPANVTLKFGHFEKIVTVNFVAGSAAKVEMDPDYLSLQTGVNGTLNVKITDLYGNFVSDARGITLTSTSGTMQFSIDNGINWYSQVTFTGIALRSVLVKDSVANTATVTAAAPSLTSDTATVYVNNAPALYIEIQPITSTTQAGEARIITIQAKDEGGNNAFSNVDVLLTSASSTMQFSTDLTYWYASLNTALNNGTAYVYYRDTKVGTNVTITAEATGMTITGKTYATIIPNSPANLTAWADKYSVSAGESVTITAQVTDIYGNAIAGKWVSFTAMVQTGKTQDAQVTPLYGATNANGQITTVFKVSSDASGSMNYCVVNTDGILGTTVTISAGGVATRYAFLPSPISLGADKTIILFINAKDGNGYNTPAGSGHENVHIYGTNENVLFSYDNGINWYKDLTLTVDSSGQATCNVKCHYTGTYYLWGRDLNASPYSPAYTTMTVTEGLFLRVSPTVETYAPAGSTISVEAQIVDQNGNTRNFSGVAIHFETDNGSIYPVDTYTDVSGRAYTTLSLSLLSNIEHIVTASMTNPSDTSNTAKIITQPVVSFAVVAPSSGFMGIPLYITVRAKDNLGNTVENYLGNITFGSTDPLANLPSNYTFISADKGIKIFSVTFNTYGSHYISVTDTADSAINGVSNVIFINYPPTPTITQTSTPTITPTITLTVTETITSTITPTITETATQTITPTITHTITETITPTITRTITQTMTQTITQTITPTITQTITQTITPTMTNTITQTITPTTTQTITPTTTQTITPTTTQTITTTTTRTITPTFTNSFTHTVTPSITITWTNSVTSTISPTHSNTPEYTWTATPTITITLTITNTPSITKTITSTITETITKTTTQTITETITQTITGTTTSTITETLTSTLTYTITETFTLTQTLTETITYTITETHTITPTITVTLTYTITRTMTPYLSPTITSTFTPTPEKILIYPNPYNPEKAISGTLKIEFLPEYSKIYIYTINGYTVFSKENCYGRIEWNGKNKNGEDVAPGIYFCVIITEDEKIIKKLIITK